VSVIVMASNRLKSPRGKGSLVRPEESILSDF
jgi:hypothetical protein